MAATYTPGDPNTPSYLRTAENGWNGSRYIGTAAPPPPPPPSPSAGPNIPSIPNVPPSPSDFGGGDPTQQARQIADARNASAPLGFDAGKWADPSRGTSHKYTAGTTLAASGSIGDVLRQPQFAGWAQVSNDKIKSPEGDIYDLYFDYGGPQQRVQYTLVGGPSWDAEQNNGYQGNVGGVTGIGTAGNRGGGGGAGGGAGSGNAQFPGGNIFSDPATQALEQVFRQRLAELQLPIDDPQRDALLKVLTSARDAGPGQDASALTTFGRQRFGDLQGDPFSGTEEKALRVERFDRMEQDRQVAKRREADRLMRLGHPPGSGTVIAALQQIDQRYDQLRAQGENDLLTYTVGERQNRQREAVGLGSFLEQQARGQSVDRIGYGTAAAGLETGARGEEDARRREALTVAALPVQLTQDRLQLGLQASGMGGQPGSILQSLLGIGNQGLAQQQVTNQGWQAFGQLLTQLGNLQRPQQPTA